MTDPAATLTLTVSLSTLDAALACLDACATSPYEPERYREWYAEAAEELRRVMPDDGRERS